MENKILTINEKEVRTTVITNEDLKLEELERTCSFENAMDDDDDVFESFMDWSSSCSYICDAISEIADNMVDIYTYDLWDNAKDVQEYIEQALSEGLCNLDSSNTDLDKIFQAGEYEYYTTALYDNIDSLCTNYILRNMKDKNIVFAFLKETTNTTEDIIKDLYERLDDDIDEIDSDHNNRFYDLIATGETILEDIFSDMMSDYEDNGLVIGLEYDIEDSIEEWLDENEEEEEEE